MESPLYVLAASAEYQWNHILMSHRVSLSPSPPCVNTPSNTMRTTPHISFTPEFDTYLASLTPGQVASPAGPPLRVKQAAPSIRRGRRRRLDPLAISVIELVLSKGIGILKQPIFPYSYATEPLRCMEIRTHLLRRYAALPPHANHSAVVETTGQLLYLWGAAIVSDGVPSVPYTPFTEKVCRKGNDLSRMVSPLKRNKNKPNPNRTFQQDKNNHENSLSPFIVKNESMDIVPLSIPKNSHLGESRREVVAAAAAGEADHQSFVSPAATSVPVSHCVLEKGVLSAKHCNPKLSAITMAKKKRKTKEKTCAARQAMQRLIRRWTHEERTLYLHGVEQYGLGSTDAISRMIPGK